jgi:hypothetical protein
VEHRLARRIGLAHQPINKRILVVRIQRVKRRRELLRSVFVGTLELVAEALEEAPIPVAPAWLRTAEA